MEQNHIHRRWCTGILVTLWWGALAAGLINDTTNIVLGIALMWVVPFLFYVVCLKIWPDEERAAAPVNLDDV